MPPDALPARLPVHPLRDAVASAPPLLLAGSDEEPPPEPHIVRGID